VLLVTDQHTYVFKEPPLCHVLRTGLTRTFLRTSDGELKAKLCKREVIGLYLVLMQCSLLLFWAPRSRRLDTKPPSASVHKMAKPGFVEIIGLLPIAARVGSYIQAERKVSALFIRYCLFLCSRYPNTRKHLVTSYAWAQVIILSSHSDCAMHFYYVPLD